MKPICVSAIWTKANSCEQAESMNVTARVRNRWTGFMNIMNIRNP